MLCFAGKKCNMVLITCNMVAIITITELKWNYDRDRKKTITIIMVL